MLIISFVPYRYYPMRDNSYRCKCLQKLALARNENLLSFHNSFFDTELLQKGVRIDSRAASMALIKRC